MSTNPRKLGKYELGERLGRGGMGEVWKAFDTQLHRNVAIKLLHADLQSDPSFVTRFQREAQVIASLHHPNIVQIYDFQVSQQTDSENATAFMVMDYVEGQTMANYIRDTSRVGKFPSALDLLHLFTPISAAIDYAHQKGMIHRDIKPANILLDKRQVSRNPMGEPVLTDFGIAKLLGTSSSTLSGWWFGTPLYTSPEQARGYPGNERSDLYSLGVILYEICTGVLPFHGENAAAILMQHINATPTSPALINPNIPPAMTLVILRSMAKDPAARFPSAAAMTIALAEALNMSVPEGLSQSPGQSQPYYSMGASSDSSYPGPVQPHLTPHLAPPVSPEVTIRATPSFPALPGSGQVFTPAGGVYGASPVSYPSPNTPIPPPPMLMQEASHYFVVQEYVGGENLKERMDRLNQPMEEREVLIYASQVLDILNDLAKQTPTVVHGDIKPANILIGAKDRRAHLVGFGTTLMDAARNNQPKQTPTSAGTAGYTPLEQLQGNADPRSDLYALAATMHHLLTNRNPRNYPPFVYPLARMLNPQLSPETERMLARALTNDINYRYQSAAEMKRDIDDILLKNYGMSADTSNFALGFSGPVGAVNVANATTGKKVTDRIGELLRLPRTENEGKTVLTTSPGTAGALPSTSQPQPFPPQRRNPRLRTILIVVLVILVVLGGLSYALLSLRNNHSNPTITTKTGSGLGIGVIREPSGEYIGLSDGTFAFDTTHTNADQMRQAAARLKAGDVGSAQALWQAAAAAETSDPEPLIYLEDQRVLASGYPYITLVVGTILSTGTYTVWRGDLQGAYVAQKEYNDSFKLPGGTQVRLLIANSGSSALYAKPVAQQIVQAAQTDKTIVGVMGWPYSSRTLNAIHILAAAHIPMVSQTATSALLTGISPYFFRVAPPDSVQAAAGAKYAEQTVHAKAVALFEDSSEAYSKSLADAFRQQFTADGNSIVATEAYTEGKPETLPARLQDALTHNPDLIYFSGFSNDVSVLIASLPTSGPYANLLVMGGDGLYVLGGYTKEAHADFSRLRFTALGFPDEWDVLGLSAQKPSFFRDYPEFFNPGGAPHPSPYGYSRPDSEVMLAFDATLALLEGGKIALTGGKKSISPDDLRHALTMITGTNAIQGVGGQIAFGLDGNPVNKAVVVLGVTQEGFIQIRAVQGHFLKGS